MVDIPEPKAGLVIRYGYLWRAERMRGQEEGVKDRPCAVVLTVSKEGEKTRVGVAPITHTPQPPGANAVPLPPETAKRLGLDAIPQWIVTTELNTFTWPGPDIRPIQGKDPATIAYGHLPSGLTAIVQTSIKEHIHTRSMTQIPRSEALRPKTRDQDRERDE